MTGSSTALIWMSTIHLGAEKFIIFQKTHSDTTSEITEGVTIKDRVVLSFDEVWEAIDATKRRLFNLIRNRIHGLQAMDLTFGEHRKEMDKIYGLILEEWSRIQEEYENKADPRGNQLLVRLKGCLYEALFYYACLKMQSFFMDAEIGGLREAPWFEATPLYDIVPVLYRYRGKRRAPQTDADFLITYADDEGPRVPTLVDVKSSEPFPNEENKERWGWQVLGALRRGFGFSIAYPKAEYPKSLEEWEIRTPCWKCGNLSSDHRKCDGCGEVLIPSTIADAHYEARELWGLLGKVRRGRF